MSTSLLENQAQNLKYIYIFLISTRVALAIGSTSSHQRAMSGSNSSGCGRISDRKMEPRRGSNLHKALRFLIFEGQHVPLALFKFPGR